ncbi:MAG: WD40 repeat domain-containing protein [Treponema sp.]|nr:WD40 repeat domain-containing protein [Treponema sp.]
MAYYKKKRIKFLIIILIFIVYFLVAARPVPKETVLSFNWISSASSAHSQEPPANITGNPMPFTLGTRFGYVDTSGQFAVNRIKINDIYLSRNMWTEYNTEPVNITINNVLNNNEINIENPFGYPILLDNRVFILGSEQNSLSEISSNGNILWTYEFGAPLTSIDAASGLVVTGSLDGTIEVFDSQGERIFDELIGGSRFSVILGCAISRNGSRIAVICGIDRQRFLLFERFSGSDGKYRIVYHEFLETGFRRPVRILFIDDDQRIIFEREGGIGCYNIKTRRTLNIPLDGEIAAIDESGSNGYFFVITAHSFLQKQIIGIKFPQDRLFGISKTAALDSIFLKAQFKSNDVFLGRTDPMLVIGGGTTLISFTLEEK